jgi:hypothetical protein
LKPPVDAAIAFAAVNSIASIMPQRPRSGKAQCDAAVMR